MINKFKNLVLVFILILLLFITTIFISSMFHNYYYKLRDIDCDNYKSYSSQDILNKFNNVDFYTLNKSVLFFNVCKNKNAGPLVYYFARFNEKNQKSNLNWLTFFSLSRSVNKIYESNESLQEIYGIKNKLINAKEYKYLNGIQIDFSEYIYINNGMVAMNKKNTIYYIHDNYKKRISSKD